MVPAIVSGLVTTRRFLSRLDVRRPVKTLVLVSALGVTLAALTWRTPAPGLGWLAADVTLVAVLLAGFARGRPGTSAWVLAAANVWLGAATCRYASRAPRRPLGARAGGAPGHGLASVARPVRFTRGGSAVARALTRGLRA